MARGAARGWIVGVLSLAAALVGISSAVVAQDRPKPAEYRSERVVLYTDLPAEKAKEWLAELEKVLDFAVAHWQRPSRGLIECYLVGDLANWKASVVERGRDAIEAGSGVTITQTLRNSSGVQARAVVYASAKGSSIKHEMVHAYCRQSFGEVGPLWYAEGMAEVGQYFTGDYQGVDCEANLARYLRDKPPPSLEDVLAMKQRGGEGYAWTWTLCHLLTHHPRYADRFRQFGVAAVSGKKADFRMTMAKDLERIDFERRLMLSHFERGYRVDLCAWDWDTPFGPPLPGTSRELSVEAVRGWQATGLEVKSGDRVPFRTQGTWRLKKNGPSITAQGGRDGAGRLVGVLLTDGKLGEPFDLGRQGTWTAPADGRLFVRCRDAWNELADNEGSITLTLPAAEGVPPPKEQVTLAGGNSKTAAGKATSSAASSLAKAAAKPSAKQPAKAPSAEAQAASKLGVAKLLLASKPDVAKRRLTEIVEQFPGTAAAKEAAELLKGLE